MAEDKADHTAKKLAFAAGVIGLITALIWLSITIIRIAIDENDAKRPETVTGPFETGSKEAASVTPPRLDLDPIEADFRNLLKEQLAPVIARQDCPDREFRLLDLQDISTPPSSASGDLHGAWAEVTLMVQGPAPAAPEIHRVKGNGQGRTEESARALARSRLLEQVVEMTRAALADCGS